MKLLLRAYEDANGEQHPAKPRPGAELAADEERVERRRTISHWGRREHTKGWRGGDGREGRMRC
jgi:hypothetical protein